MSPSGDTLVADHIISYMSRYRTISKASQSRIANSPKLKDFILALVEDHYQTFWKVLSDASIRCTNLKKDADIAANEERQRQREQEANKEVSLQKGSTKRKAKSVTPPTKKARHESIPTKLLHGPSRPFEDDDEDTMSVEEPWLVDQTDVVEGAPSHEHDQDVREETEGLPSDVEEAPSTGDEASDEESLFVNSRGSRYEGARQPSPSPIANADTSLTRTHNAAAIVSTDPQDTCDSGIETAKDLDNGEKTNTLDVNPDETARAETQDPDDRNIDPITTPSSIIPAITAGPHDDLLKKYYFEYGVMNDKAPVIQRLRDHCLKFSSNHFDGVRKEVEFQEILISCAYLELYYVRSELVEFLRNRIARPGHNSTVPSIWSMNDPDQILNALGSMNNNTNDARIHRAYGQMRLFSKVEDRVKNEIVHPNSKGRHIEPYLSVLDSLAEEHAGKVTGTEQNKIKSNYRREYYAGKRWREVADLFGGPGVVLAFVCAKIGPSYVANSWSDYQRKCLAYISQDLHSIKEIVDAMGEDVLDQYCQHGCLDEAAVGEIENVDGCLAFSAEQYDAWATRNAGQAADS